MDKSNGTEWLSKTINNLTTEGAKLFNMSKAKIDATTMKQNYNETLSKLAKMLIEKIESGEIKRELFEPEYSILLNQKEIIDKKNEEAKNIKENLHNPFRSED